MKPSKPRPDVILSLSTIDNDPNNELILEIICVFAPNPYVQDHTDHHPASFLQLTLSNALVYYYPLAGKLHRRTNDQRLQLNCKVGDGVSFIKATASCTLSSLNYLESYNHLDGTYHQLVPSHDTLKGCNYGYKPLALQVTKFACGGMTIGITHSHTVCHLGMHQDVWGGLVNIIPLVPITLPFLCILMPESKAVPRKSSAVRVLITLPRDAMTKFKEEMDALQP